MQAIFFFFISLWNASGQGYSNCVLRCPAIQSPIIIFLGFVAFISGGSVGVAVAECQCGIIKGSVTCVHLLGGCLPGCSGKDYCGFCCDWQVGFFSPFAFFFFFLIGYWKINNSSGKKEFFFCSLCRKLWSHNCQVVYYSLEEYTVHGSYTQWCCSFSLISPVPVSLRNC